MARGIRRYMDLVGVEEVEDFIDACLSVEDLIDIYSPFIQRREKRANDRFGSEEPKEAERNRPPRYQSKDYMDSFVNPREVMLSKPFDGPDKSAARRIPERPERDVLLFVLEHAPLERGKPTCSRSSVMNRITSPAGANEDHERRLG